MFLLFPAIYAILISEHMFVWRDTHEFADEYGFDGEADNFI